MSSDYGARVLDFVKVYSEAIVSSVERFSKTIPGGLRYELFYDSVFLDVSLKTGMSYQDIASLSRPIHWMLFNSDDPYFEISPNREGVSNIRVIRFPVVSDLVEAVSNNKESFNNLVARHKSQFDGT